MTVKYYPLSILRPTSNTKEHIKAHYSSTQMLALDKCSYPGNHFQLTKNLFVLLIPIGHKDTSIKNVWLNHGDNVDVTVKLYIN